MTRHAPHAPQTGDGGVSAAESLTGWRVWRVVRTWLTEACVACGAFPKFPPLRARVRALMQSRATHATTDRAARIRALEHELGIIPCSDHSCAYCDSLANRERTLLSHGVLSVNELRAINHQ